MTTYITACEYPHAEKSKKIAVFVVRDEFIVDFLFTKFYNYDSLFFYSGSVAVDDRRKNPTCRRARVRQAKKYSDRKEFFKMKKFIRAAALIMAAASLAALVSCGKTTGDNTETTADGAKTDKVWVIATDTVFKPFEFRDEKDNLVGIDVDIVAAIAEDQGFKYELRSLGWDASIQACQSAQANAMIAGASITEKRVSEGWIFSDSYYDAAQCMAVAIDSDINGFADLSGKLVCVKNGTQGADYAESLKDQYGFTLTYVEDSPTMYQYVSGGQAAACFEDTPIMASTIHDQNDTYKLRIVEGSENDGAGYGMAIFDESNRELLDMFNAGLKNIKASGKYDEILAKYLG